MSVRNGKPALIGGLSRGAARLVPGGAPRHTFSGPGGQRIAPRPAVAPISVAVIESQTVVREGLRVLIDAQADMQTVGEASSLRGASELDVEPRVVLTTLDLPDSRGDDVVAGLRRRFPGASVFVLSAVDHPAFVQQVLAAGANGYLPKTGTARELFEGIRAVAGGGTFLQPSLGVKLARWRDASSGVEGSGGAVLSPREVKVLGLVAVGHTNAEVAELLGVSLRTVETHRARLLQKLGRPTRAELVRFAYEFGLIGPPTDQ